MDRSLGTLLISCPDQRGIVAALAQVLHDHGSNILSADQHRDATTGEFFQRITIDNSALSTELTALEAAINEMAQRFAMNVKLSTPTSRSRVAIFVSKYDHCLYDLLWRHQAGELPCDVALIVSNHTALKPIADQFGIEFHTFPITKETKAQQERREHELLQQKRIELVVLARYMQILSAEFVAEFPDRIINIHHSFLPAFSGGRPYHQAHTRGVKLIGATAHYATSGLDEGPIIEQDVIRASHRDSVADLTRKGRDVERAVLGRAVRWHLEHRVLVWGNRTVVFE